MRHHRHRHGLRKTMFWGLGAAIGATAGVVALVAWLIGDRAGWWHEKARAERFLSGQLARVWDEPAARERFVGDLARDLEVGVRLVDAGGRVLVGSGECTKHHDIAAPEGGRLEICWEGRRGPGWRGPVYVIAPAIVLWMLAGLWARRLARPIAELTRVARDLGAGKLDRRARLPRHVPDEFAGLATALNDMANRIEEQLRGGKELLAGVSHELRSPLARVRLLVELGREGREVFADLEREAVIMDELVGQLLATARLDFGAASPRPLDVRDLVRRAVARAAELYPETAAPALELDLAPAEPLHADATLLQRALGVMLDNARRHGGGAKVVRVAQRDGEVAFEVDDAGAGFVPEDLPRVFEPFFRGRGAAHDEARGVGLGLAIVQRVAAEHRGRAYAENLPGGGARVGFVVRSAG